MFPTLEQMYGHLRFKSRHALEPVPGPPLYLFLIFFGIHCLEFVKVYSRWLKAAAAIL